jgi:hypothetical protein
LPTLHLPFTIRTEARLDDLVAQAPVIPLPVVVLAAPPIRSVPKAASRPSRQKQFPAMRLVKSGCDFFRVWFRLDRFGGSSLMVVSAVFNEGPSSHGECRRASDQHSLLSARLFVRKAPGDLFESRKERAVSSSNRAVFSERPRNFSDARHS